MTPRHRSLPSSRLVELLLAAPLGERASLLMAAVSFRPNRTLSESFRVGPLRAAFAEYWEANYRSAVPMRSMKKALEPPIRIGTVLEFNKFDYLQDPDELESQLAG
jgi:hypothetical protein